MRRLTHSLLLATALAVSSAPLVQAQESDVFVTKSGPEEAAPDTDVSYSVGLTNFGPDDATPVTLTDEIPAGMAFVSGVQDDGPSFSCSYPSPGDTIGSISCTIPTLPAGSSANFTFVFHIPPATPPGTFFTNIATAATPADPNSENDSAVAVTSTPLPPQGDLLVLKSGPPAAEVDTDVVYTITISNGGPDEALDATLNDTLPSTMTFVSMLQQSGPAMSCTTPSAGSGGLVSCSIASLAAGATATFTLTTHIPAGTPGGTTFVNTVTVSTSSNDPNPDNDISFTTLVASSADVSVVKLGPGTATAGTNISYTITVTNGGPDSASNVTLLDPLPPNTTFVSLTQDNGPAAACTVPVGASGTVSCNFPVLANGVSAQFTLVIEAGNTTSVTNTASVLTESAGNSPANDTSTVITSVTPSADVAVTKSGPATVDAGTNVTYTITVTNNGPSDATNVSLTDTTPANTTFVSANQTGGPTFSCTTPAIGAAGTIACTLATLAPADTAAFSFVLHVSPSAPSGSSIANTADLSATTADPGPGDNTSTTTATVVANANLAVTKSGPPSAEYDSDVTYMVTATNNGPADAVTVSLTDVLPANTTFVSATQTTGPTFSCTTPAVGAGGTIACTIATFALGGTATFSFVVHVSPLASDGSSIANTADLTTTTTDLIPGNNTSTTTTTVVANADVAVTKSGPPSAAYDTDVTYLVTATNNGPAHAVSVSLTDVVPANTTFVSATQASGPTFTCTTPAVGAGGTITCTIGTFAAGDTATFSLVVHVSPAAPDGSSIANTANLTSTTTDLIPGNNTSTTTATVVATADVDLTKTGPPSADVDSDVTYVVTVTNNGPANATAVSLTDVLPASTTFVSATQTSGPIFTCTTPAVGAGGTITCTITTLPNGTSAAFAFVLHIDPLATGTIANTATVTTPSDPTPGNNAGTTATAVVGAAGIPTLSPLALALMALSLAAVGLFARRP